MPREIDRKLSLTAAAIGAYSRKDLAGAFHAVNPATRFDIGRAHKWLQGRAVPRSGDIYADWVAVLGLDRTADWLAECSADELLQELSRRPDLDADTLQRRSQGFLRSAPAGAGTGDEAPARPAAAERPDLSGVYACYSHAWSHYFPGRLIRGELVVAPDPASGRLAAQYAEVLPTGRYVVEGEVRVGDRFVQLDAGERHGSACFQFSLFRPPPPASLLAGLMMGAPLLSPDPEPTVTRIVMLRLPAPSPVLRTAEAYLPAGASLVADLASLGLDLAEPAATEGLLGELLGRRQGQGTMDRMPVGPYRQLLARLDSRWLSGPPPPARPLRVVRGGGRTAEPD